MGVFCVAWIGLNLLTEFALGRLLVSRFDGIGFLVLGGFYFFFFFFSIVSVFGARVFPHFYWRLRCLDVFFLLCWRSFRSYLHVKNANFLIQRWYQLLAISMRVSIT